GLGFGVGGPLALYLGSACIDAFGWRAQRLRQVAGSLAEQRIEQRQRQEAFEQAIDEEGGAPADALPGATPGQAWRSADFWLIVGNLILGVFA
ncbi:MFS transporter, partial [Pseudomonas aeruginosa]